MLWIYVAFAPADFAPRIVFGQLLPGRVVSGVIVRDDVDATEVVVVVEEFFGSASGGALLRCQKLRAEPEKLSFRSV